MDNLVAYSLKGGFPQFIFVIALLLGAIALTYTPREEEPQIRVVCIGTDSLTVGYRPGRPDQGRYPAFVVRHHGHQ